MAIIKESEFHELNARADNSGNSAPTPDGGAEANGRQTRQPSTDGDSRVTSTRIAQPTRVSSNGAQVDVRAGNASEGPAPTSLQDPANGTAAASDKTDAIGESVHTQPTDAPAFARLGARALKLTEDEKKFINKLAPQVGGSPRRALRFRIHRAAVQLHRVMKA